MTIFVDTGIWYAAADRRDRHHDRARELLTIDEPLLLSDLVLAEVWRLLAQRLHEGAAERWWSQIRAGVAIIEPCTPGDLDVAWGIGRVFADQTFSLVDRASFAVMERLGLRRVASFDSDFAIYRFGLHRDQAFTLLG